MDSIMLPEPLQSMLDGLEPRAITNFYGTPGTGKTNLCMLAAVDCARRGGKVVYIDTEGGFSVERLRQVVAPSDFENVLENIELVEPKDLQEQTAAVRKVAERRPALVILDSSVALYRVEHANRKETIDNKNRKCDIDSIMVANRELSKQLSVLSALSREHDIPVLITTHAFKSWGNGEYDVVGGDPIRYWSKSIIFLEKTGKPHERRARIIKHRSQPEGKEAKFVLVQDGIKPSRGILHL
jgi:DNA repair protein RadB